MKLNDEPKLIREILKDGDNWPADPDFAGTQTKPSTGTIEIPRDLKSAHLKIVFRTALNAVVAGSATCSSFYYKVTNDAVEKFIVFGGTSKTGVTASNTIQEDVQACDGFGMRVTDIVSATATKIEVWAVGFENERVGG